MICSYFFSVFFCNQTFPSECFKPSQSVAELQLQRGAQIWQSTARRAWLVRNIQACQPRRTLFLSQMENDGFTSWEITVKNIMGLELADFTTRGVPSSHLCEVPQLIFRPYLRVFVLCGAKEKTNRLDWDAIQI